MRILVVEDDQMLQEQLVDVLKKMSSQVVVDTNESADETITFMESQRLNPKFGYDLIIADVALSGTRNGFDLWRVCSEQNPDTEFMFISGISSVEFLKRVAIEGDPDRCPPFLCKPFTLQEFRNLVMQLVGSRLD